jgi:hypothetical protein
VSSAVNSVHGTLVYGGCFVARTTRVRKIRTPEVRRRSQKLNSYPLPLFAQISQEHDAAFNLFLSFGVCDHQEFADVYLVLHHQKPAVQAHDQRFACFAKLLAAVRAALRLHFHLAKDSRAAPRRRELDRGIHAPMFFATAARVNCPCAQVFRIRNGLGVCACSLPQPSLTIDYGGAEARPSPTFIPDPQTFFI